MPAPIRTPRPYLALILTTLGLVALLGVVGTVSYLLGFTGYLPLAAAFIPLALALAIFLTVRQSWVATGFRPVAMTHTRAPIAIMLVAALPIAVIACSNGFSVAGSPILTFAGLALLVGFVEETIFRGVLLSAFASRGPIVGVVATSIGFAVAHSAAAISPNQSPATSLYTIVFALLFGVIASLLVRITDSILPAITLHAIFDFAGFVLHPRSATDTDLVSIVVAAALVAALVLISRRKIQRVRR